MSIHLRYVFAINLWIFVLAYGIAILLGFGVKNALSFSIKAIMVTVQEDNGNKAAKDWMELYQVIMTK